MMRSAAMTLIQGTLFVFLLKQQLPQMFACPSEFKRRDDGTCCKTKICSAEEGYFFCNGTSKNPGEDGCFKCPKGTHNRDPINTADMPGVWQVCVPIDCTCELYGTIIENRAACETGEEDKICACDRNHLYFGDDPIICERVEDPTVIARIQRPGFELTPAGKVERCRKGYYKPAANMSICIPHQKCRSGYRIKNQGTTTADSMCEEIPTERETTIRLPPDREKNETYIPEVKVKPTNSPPTQVHVFIIIGTCILVPFLLLICAFCVWQRKNPEKYRCVEESLKRRFGINTDRHQAEDEENPFEPLNIQQTEQINNQTNLQSETGERGSEPEIPSDSLHGDLSEPLSDVTYVRQGNVIQDLSTPLTSFDSVNQVHGEEENSTGLDVETSLKTFTTSDNSNIGVSVLGENNGDNGRPIGRVVPNVRVENQGDQNGLIASPAEDDNGQLVPGGQRVIADPIYLLRSPGDDQQSLDLSELGVQRVLEHSVN